MRTGRRFIIDDRRSPVALVRQVTSALIRRVAYICALSVVLFCVIHAMPGGLAGVYRTLDPNLTQAEIDRLLTLEGRNHSVLQQYRCWCLGRTVDGCERWPGGGILRGDLGFSRRFQRPVVDLLMERLGHTIRIMVPAILLAILIAVVCGWGAARWEGRWIDRSIRVVTVALQSAPLQWSGLMAILVGAIYLSVFPPGGVTDFGQDTWRSRFWHAVLPVLCLSAYYGAFWTRYLRMALLSAAARPHVTAARAKGLSEIQVWRHHIVPQGLVPMLTSISITIPSVFSGVLVIEKVFSYPGLGLLMFDSIRFQDPLTAMVGFLLYAMLAMLATVAADALVGWLHPEALRRSAR
ncbi:MAG: ABC transporter permease [Myxococcota bacterium]